MTWEQALVLGGALAAFIIPTVRILMHQTKIDVLNEMEARRQSDVK